MMQIVVNNEGTLRFLTGLSERLDLRTAQIVEGAAAQSAESIKFMLSRNGQHRRGDGMHAPPGETPRMESGHLHDSVQTSPPRRIGFGRYSAAAGPTAYYAEFVDAGTRRMAARPYMERARNHASVAVDSFLRAVSFELVR